jgi:hypothetical protein
MTVVAGLGVGIGPVDTGAMTVATIGVMTGPVAAVGTRATIAVDRGGMIAVAMRVVRTRGMTAAAAVVVRGMAGPTAADTTATIGPAATAVGTAAMTGPETRVVEIGRASGRATIEGGM